jgi:hypothetical protein
MERPRLLPSLMTELFQTERSAYRHPIREAKRLGDVPPAIALRAVAAHANEVLDELPKLARARRLEIAGLGTVVGETFSDVRHFFADRFVDRERSYRGTLLGMRHGIDLVRLVRAAAEDEADAELASWCDRWLTVRERLVAGVERELDWFGHHQAFAARQAIPLRFARSM